MKPELDSDRLTAPETTARSNRQKKLDRFLKHPITDISVMGLIVVSIVLLVWELGSTDPDTQDVLRVINESLIGVFAIELALRYYAETKKKRFFRNYWIDILSIVPFLRPLRVLRVFRLLRVFRSGLTLSRRMGWLDASLQREAVQWFAVAVFIFAVVLFGTIGLQLSGENFDSFGEAAWWSIMSLVAGEPIGEVPTTTFGRVVALTVMGAGLTVFAMLTGVISAVMIHRLGSIDLREMDIDELTGHIVICGWNRSGMLLVEELQADPTGPRPIVLVGEFDQPPAWPSSVTHPDLIYLVRGDFTRLEVLEKAGLAQCTHAIVLADRLKDRSDQDRDARTVLTAMLIERFKKEIFTSVELLNRDNESFLRTVGVDEIIVGTEYAASIIATSTKTRGIVGVFDELLSSKYGNQFFKVTPPDSLIGKSYQHAMIEMKVAHDAMLLGIEVAEGDRKKFLVNPDKDYQITDKCVLLTVAHAPPGGRT